MGYAAIKNDYPFQRGWLIILIMINDAPYGTEKDYDAFRSAIVIQRDHAEVQANVFLMADAVGCAIPNQNTVQDYYNVVRMVKSTMQNAAISKSAGLVQMQG